MPDPDRETDPSLAPAELRRVLSEIQRRGAIGRGAVDAAVEHAQQFVAALPAEPGLLVDLGAGGGLPGLVIAVHAPAWRLVLIERRAKRADLLAYAVRTLGVDNRVIVRAEDVRITAQRVEYRGACSVVTARSFAPPLEVLRMGTPFLAHPGRVLISEPPDGEPRWTARDLDLLGFDDDGRRGGIRVFSLR